MTKITLNSHDLLGQLTIVKSCLAIVKTNEQDQPYLQQAIKATQQIINRVKKAVYGQNSAR